MTSGLGQYHVQILASHRPVLVAILRQDALGVGSKFTQGSHHTELKLFPVPVKDSLLLLPPNSGRPDDYILLLVSSKAWPI
jgi:hypothetical protein